jgi:soluble lytic murein transglycosylase-like protein
VKDLYYSRKLKLLFVAIIFDLCLVVPTIAWDHLLESDKYFKHYRWMTTEKFTAIYNAHLYHGVSMDEICAIIQSESDGVPTAKSCVGARGLMQIMPQYHYKGNPDDLYNVQLNVMIGTKIWKDFKALAKNDMKLAIIYYNGGPAYPVHRYSNWKYLNKIIANNYNTRQSKNKIIIVD